MSNGELVWFSWGKIRSQNTLVNASPAKDFAGSTRANNNRRRGGVTAEGEVRLSELDFEGEGKALGQEW